MTTRCRLPQNVVNRILTERLRSLHKRLAKTNVLDFFRFDAVFTNVLDTISRPHELIDSHSAILGERTRTRNASAERPGHQPRRVFCADGCMPVLARRCDRDVNARTASSGR